MFFEGRSLARRNAELSRACASAYTLKIRPVCGSHTCSSVGIARETDPPRGEPGDRRGAANPSACRRCTRRVFRG